MAEPTTDSTLRTTSQALIFIGQLTTVGGALTLLRTGEKSIFLAALMPIGLVAAGIGFYLRYRILKQASENEATNGEG